MARNAKASVKRQRKLISIRKQRKANELRNQVQDTLKWLIDDTSVDRGVCRRSLQRQMRDLMSKVGRKHMRVGRWMAIAVADQYVGS